MTFDSLQIIEPILRALKNEGYTTPTPIQSQTIPLTLAGKDILGCAQTGTGKTAAFAIPILQLLEAKPVNPKQRKIRSLIVTPTRELAIQIGESFDAYGKFTSQKNTVVFGGVGQKPQTDALQRGVDILIATPGRLLDLCQQGYVHFRDLEIFVLDEADRMLDMGFIHDIRKLIALLPKQRQSLFFSATMPPEITKLASSILIRPERVEVTPVSSTAETITQFLLYTDKGNKNALLMHILEDKAIKSALVFTRTKHGADKVVKFLQHHHIKAEAIHGNKAQNARQRALNNFKSGETRVLVATDIASRGIDVDDLGFVINFEIPNIPETYVHRIGRTGRAGASGIALSFCDASEKPFLKDIEKLTGIRIPVQDKHPYPLMDHNPAPAEKKQQGRNNNQRRPERQAKPQSGGNSQGQKSDRKPSGFKGRVI
jgi:ATP-dependent RNA helicase RhlE